jgi:hypothetical protein
VVFGTQEAIIKDFCNAGFNGGVKSLGDWKSFFAWFPVKIEKKYTWLKKVYRRQIHYRLRDNVVVEYEYGSLFTILKD